MNKPTDIQHAEVIGVGVVCGLLLLIRNATNGLFCGLLLTAIYPAGVFAQLSESPDPARESIQTVDRAFGLQLGDLVTRTVKASGNAARFAPDKLPRPGPVSAWVHLLSIEVDERTDQAGDAKWLTLTYQITGAAPAVTLLELPVLQLLGAAERDAPVLARLDAIPVSVSPIMGEQPFQRSGMGDLQADALVLPVSAATWQQLMWAMAVLATLLTALLLGRLWRRQRPATQTPFVQATVNLKSERTLSQAYQHLHRAFDRSARQSLMHDDIPAFIEANPAYKEIQSEINDFFVASRDQFFRQSSDPGISEVTDTHNTEIRSLRAVAGKLAKIEKALL